jgi:hypothetical protein
LRAKRACRGSISQWQKKGIPLDEIRLYVGEDKNPNNEKRVGSVDIGLPALKLREPLEFVDTPGLGSVFAHNTTATRDWLPNVGAALVAISSDAPLSERDLELLDELAVLEHTPIQSASKALELKLAIAELEECQDWMRRQ